MQPNIGLVDRYARLVTGIIAVSCGSKSGKRLSLGKSLLVPFGAMRIAEGITGWCPMTQLCSMLMQTTGQQQSSGQAGQTQQSTQNHSQGQAQGQAPQPSQPQTQHAATGAGGSPQSPKHANGQSTGQQTNHGTSSPPEQQHQPSQTAQPSTQHQQAATAHA